MGVTLNGMQVPTMEEFEQLQAEVDNLEQRVTALEEGATAPPPNPVASPDGTKIIQDGPTFYDDLLHEWRLTAGRTIEWRRGEVWEAAGISYDVAIIEKWKDTCYQSNIRGEWYSWSTDHWVRASGDPSGAPPVVKPPAGAYGVSNGQIVDSNGNRFIANGFCLLDQQAHVAVTGPDCMPLLRDFPTCNFIHFMPWGWTWYTWPDEYAQIVQWLTDKGIVVEIGNWQTWPAVPTGDTLTQECAWYHDLATRYKDNPRIWFSTCNEPQDWYVGLPAGSITAEQVAVYNTIRGVGNNTIIGILGTGGTMSDGLTPVEAYLSMTNVHWDAHFYNWLSGGSQDYNTCVNAVYGVINSLSVIKSGDGVIPILFGECGNATDGAHIDDWPPGPAMQAVMDVSRTHYNGSGMFCAPFWPAAMGGQPGADQIVNEWDGTLTDFGRQIQTTYATGAVTATAHAEKKWPTKEELRAAVEQHKAG